MQLSHCATSQEWVENGDQHDEEYTHQGIVNRGYLDPETGVLPDESESEYDESNMHVCYVSGECTCVETGSGTFGCAKEVDDEGLPDGPHIIKLSSKQCDADGPLDDEDGGGDDGYDEDGGGDDGYDEQEDEDDYNCDGDYCP